MPHKTSYFPLSWLCPSWATHLTRKVVFAHLPPALCGCDARSSWHKPIHCFNNPHLKRSSGICQYAANMPAVLTAGTSPQPPKITTPEYSIQHVHLHFFCWIIGCDQTPVLVSALCTVTVPGTATSCLRGATKQSPSCGHTPGRFALSLMTGEQRLLFSQRSACG